MSIYSIDVRVYATAYIRANSEAEALAIARDLKDSAIEVSGGGHVAISGLALINPNLPDVSLSPAMTVRGPDDDAQPELAE